MATHRTIYGVLALVLGLWLAGHSGAADDEPKDPREGILKIAGLLEKGMSDDAKKVAGTVAKDAKIDAGKPESCQLLMRTYATPAKGGIGVGKNPNQSIEAKILVLDQKQLTPKALMNEAADIKKLALVSAAIGSISIEATPPAAAKAAAKWKQWSEEMRDYGIKLADASGKGDIKAVQTAARNLGGSCTSCHEMFRK